MIQLTFETGSHSRSRLQHRSVGEIRRGRQRSHTSRNQLASHTARLRPDSRACGNNDDAANYRSTRLRNEGLGYLVAPALAVQAVEEVARCALSVSASRVSS
jgi:hypothetical protein